MSQPLRFPEWYYGGPYLRVKSPDTDLPLRDPTVPISLDWQQRTELDGVIEGERYVAPFRDANGIDVIIGLINIAIGYPEAWDQDERHRYPTIQGILGVIVLRIETKLRCKPGRIRANWFAVALEHVRQAMPLYAAGNYVAAAEHLTIAREHIEQGNRVTRRKVAFIVAPDGTAKKL